MSTGWIKLHRSLLDWEWYDDINTKVLFIHLLLVSNHKDNQWRGIDIKRGQRLTSISGLAKETGLSIKNIRTSIKRLKATNEVASHSTAQHTVFTMVNYDLYQEGASEVANKGQANGKQVATNKNDKTDKNVNKKTFCQLIANEYNLILGDTLPRVKLVNDSRVSAINGTIKQFKGNEKDFSDIETWKGFFNFVLDSNFLIDGANGWKADFDFLTKKNNVLKVCEGKYHNDNQ